MSVYLSQKILVASFYSLAKLKADQLIGIQNGSEFHPDVLGLSVSKGTFMKKNKSFDSPFDYMPVATWVLAIGVVVTFIALSYIQFLMN